MKSPVSRYLIGYIFRAILGTALVLIAISAVRTMFLSERISPGDNLWEKVLEYPDRLVNMALEKYAPQYLPGGDDGDSVAAQPAKGDSVEVAQTSDSYTPSVAYGEPADHSASSAGMENSTAVSAMPAMPSMPNIGEDRPSSRSRPPDAPMPGSGEWGLTTDYSTPVYSVKGKRVTHMPAGKTFVVVDHKNTGKGEFVICTLPNKPSVRFVLKSEDTILYNCDYNATTPEQRQLCIRQAKTVAAINARKEQIDKQMESRNPYAERYHSALAEYKRMAKHNNALLKAYNSATGPRRMEIADKLRLMKEDSVHAIDSFHAIKQQYKDWNAQHSGSSPDYDNDSRIKRLKRELADIEHKLANP